MSPPASALFRLAHKYQRLGELRRARTRGEPIPPREVFKRLADEFPGCLNELDTLPLEAIEARAAALAGAAETGAVEPWMRWLFGYHALMRAALWTRMKLAPRHVREGESARDDALVVELCKGASRHAGFEVDTDFVRAVARPPGGRLKALVFAELEGRFGAPSADIKRALFPGRSDRAPG